MLDKIKAMWALFAVGKSVADPAKWKSHQITATMLGGFIIALVQLAKVFGYEIPVDSDTATAIAGGLVAGVNIILTITTSKSVGIAAKAGAVPAAEQALPSVQQDAPTESAQSPVQPVVVPAVDDHAALVERARQWAAEHRKFDNDQSPTYENG